jgi:hypothetical protein
VNLLKFKYRKYKNSVIIETPGKGDKSTLGGRSKQTSELGELVGNFRSRRFEIITFYYNISLDET